MQEKKSNAQLLTEKSSILFMTHIWSAAIAHRFNRLRNQVAGRMDCFLLLQDDAGDVRKNWMAFLSSTGAVDSLILFQKNKLETHLGFRYFRGGPVPGSAHFPLLALYRNLNIKYYWVIEYDVEFRGDWQLFFNAFAECDSALIGSHIQTYDRYPNFYWWDSFVSDPKINITRSDLLKAFLPIYRISRDALDCIYSAHQSGWVGHAEVLIPSVLRLNGYGIQDLNEVSICYQGSLQDPSSNTHLQSTIRFRPEVSLYEFVNRDTVPLLFHPVKQDWIYCGSE